MTDVRNLPEKPFNKTVTLELRIRPKAASALLESLVSKAYPSIKITKTITLELEPKVANSLLEALGSKAFKD